MQAKTALSLRGEDVVKDALSNQLETTLELSTSTAAQSTISALESKINTLESLIHTARQAPPVVKAPPAPAPTPAQPETKSLTNILARWKKTVEGQRSSVCKEQAMERERLSSAREE